VRRVPRVLTGGQVAGYDPLPGDQPQAARVLTGGQVVDEPEEPGLLESTLRGAGQGASFGFQDEIAGALESAFTDKTYKQARDESRARNAAAEAAHPWGYGLGSVLGTAGTGLVTGGLAAGAAKAGAGAVAKLAAAEGAAQALGSSDADLTEGQFGQAAKDTAIGGVVGGVLGGGLHKLLGHTVDTAIERRGKDLNELIGEGGVPTVRKRLGQATGVREVGVREGETAASTEAAGSEHLAATRTAAAADAAESAAPQKVERSLGVNVIDSDPELLKALNKGKKQATAVAEARIHELGKETAPVYRELDSEFDGGIRLGRVIGAMENAATEAKQQYAYNVGEAVQEHSDRFLATWRKRLDLEPGVDLNEVHIPTFEVRKLATRLQMEATSTMGALSETERLTVKKQVAQVAKGILDDHLDEAARALPDMAPQVQKLRDLNDKSFVYSSVRDALVASANTMHTKGPGLLKSLTGASLPALGGLALSGGNPVGFAAGALGAQLAQSGARRVSRDATMYLARLVRAARAGNATSQLALDAIKGGVPAATVNTIMSNVGQPLALAAGSAVAEGVGSALEGRGGRGGGEAEAE
jgi:hypothetical protein